MLPSRIDRFLLTYMARNPRTGAPVLMGLIWFGAMMVAAIAASAVGPAPLALFFGVVGAVAALQAGLAWRRARSSINQPLAALGALVLPITSLVGNRIFAVVLIVFVALAVVLGDQLRPDPAALNAEAIAGNLPVAGATLRVALPLAFLGASLVQIERVSWLLLAVLIAIVTVYDAGHYLVGTTMGNRFAGIGAGLAGNLVVVFAASAVNPPPFDSDGSIRLVVLVVALSCPLGQWLGSFMLPNALAKAPWLRRLDAWLVAAPLLWALAAIAS